MQPLRKGQAVEAAEVIATYGAAWNEADDVRRLALLELAWADEGVYQDPTGRVEGREALVAHIAGFREMMAGHAVDVSTGVDVYTDLFRFGWVMRDGGDVVMEGMDFGKLSSDGRIKRLYGFFGPFPPLDG